MNHGDVVGAGQHPGTAGASAASLYAQAARRHAARAVQSRAFAAGETPIVSVRDLVVDYGGRQGFFRKEQPKRALHGVSIDVLPRTGRGPRRRFGLRQDHARPRDRRTGQAVRADRSSSKAGRSTGARPAYWDYRLNCQMVFQDPYSSLDPRMTIGDLVGEALRLMPDMSAGGKTARVREALERSRPR